jgi:hypothetical protein
VSNHQTIRSGVWKTAGGSILTLVIEENLVTGTYASIHGQPKPGEVFPIVGFVNDDLISFTTSWGPYKSMTSWVGRHGFDQGRECIRTNWTVVRKYADRAHTQENEYWESFINYTGTYYLEK